MISDDVAIVADKLAGFAARSCTVEPEIAGLMAAILMDAAMQARELEALPFVVIPHER